MVHSSWGLRHKAQGCLLVFTRTCTHLNTYLCAFSPHNKVETTWKPSDKSLIYVLNSLLVCKWQILLFDALQSSHMLHSSPEENAWQVSPPFMTRKSGWSYAGLKEAGYRDWQHDSDKCFPSPGSRRTTQASLSGLGHRSVISLG